MKSPRSVSTGAADAKRDKWPWLVMVYMAGDNCLTEEMVLSLQDIMQSGAPHGGIVVAQLDPGGTGIATQRYAFSVPPPEPRSPRPAPLPPHLEDYRDRTFDGLEGIPAAGNR